MIVIPALKVRIVVTHLTATRVQLGIEARGGEKILRGELLRPRQESVETPRS
jgi:hypothetical protein